MDDKVLSLVDALDAWADGVLEELVAEGPSEAKDFLTLQRTTIPTILGCANASASARIHPPSAHLKREPAAAGQLIAAQQLHPLRDALPVEAQLQAGLQDGPAFGIEGTADARQCSLRLCDLHIDAGSLCEPGATPPKVIGWRGRYR